VDPKWHGRQAHRPALDSQVYVYAIGVCRSSPAYLSSTAPGVASKATSFSRNEFEPFGSIAIGLNALFPVGCPTW